MVNNRVTYAISQLAVKDFTSAATNVVLPLSSSGTNPSGYWEVPRGIQSVGLTTAFDLESVFEWGKIGVYENVEGVPDVEVTVSRVIDGTHPLYLIASDSSGADTLIARNETYRADITFNIYPDTQDSTDQGESSGLFHVSAVYVSGMYMSSVTYNMPVDGNFTEEVTFVGNDKFWSAVVGGSAASGYFPSGVVGSTEDPTVNVGNLDGVQRRENFNRASSTFPNLLPGIVSGVYTADSDCIQTITVTADLGREEVFCLGQKNPFFRFVTLPLEVTTTFEVHSKQGDLVEADSTTDNLVNETIILKTTSGLQLHLGSSNKLTGVDESGNDAAGGSLAVTYTFQNFGFLTVTHDNYS